MSFFKNKLAHIGYRQDVPDKLKRILSEDLRDSTIHFIKKSHQTYRIFEKINLKILKITQGKFQDERDSNYQIPGKKKRIKLTEKELKELHKLVLRKQKVMGLALKGLNNYISQLDELTGSFYKNRDVWEPVNINKKVILTGNLYGYFTRLLDTLVKIRDQLKEEIMWESDEDQLLKHNSLVSYRMKLNEDMYRYEKILENLKESFINDFKAVPNSGEIYEKMDLIHEGFEFLMKKSPVTRTYEKFADTLSNLIKKITLKKEDSFVVGIPYIGLLLFSAPYAALAMFSYEIKMIKEFEEEAKKIPKNPDVWALLDKKAQ